MSSSADRSISTKKTLRSAKDFEHYFNPNAYLARRFSKSPRQSVEEGDPWGGEVSFVLKTYHDFFTTKFQPDSAKVLEFGGGPVIAYLISAAPFASDILFAEYAEVCRIAVQKWKDGDSDAHNWSPFFNHVVCGFEGKSAEAALTREIKLKAKISNIIGCDAFGDDPIGVERSHERFDVVCLNYCLTSACKDHEEFRDCTKRLVRLLKPGGWLTLAASSTPIKNSGDPYYFDVNDKVEDEESFFSLPISEEFVQDAFKKAGLSSILCESYKTASGLRYTSIFLVAGQFNNEEKPN